MTNINYLGKAFAKYCGLSLLLLTPTLTHAQFSVSDNKTAAQLANSLVGASSGIVITNPTLNCPTQSNGSYTNTPNATLGLGNGILLTSGSAAAVNSPGTTQTSVNTNTGGDASLTTLSGQATNDACVLEFDFVPQGDSIRFRYQFGSEEYPGYTCTQYNDVFGFFISGPGYASPTNIALVPGTNVAVAINSVNNGPTGAGQISTCNAMGTGSPFTSYFINHAGSGAVPVYDGYTSVFTARAKVQPCQSYHLKLGVADGSDHILDSGVFVEAGSLTVLPPVITGCPSNITTCNPVVSWTPPSVVNTCLNITDSTKSHLPGSTFPEGTTTVTYTYSNVGGTSTCSFTVTVYPVPVVTPVPTNTTYTGGIPTNIYLGYGPQNTTLTPVAGPAGTTYAWTPAGNLSCTNCANPVFTPTVWGTYNYTVVATYPNGCTRSANVSMCVKEARVNGWDGRAVWVCHRTGPTGMGANQITLLANVPQHIGPHPYDFLGRCDQTCNNPDGPDQKNIQIALNGSRSFFSPEFAVTTYPNPFTNEMHMTVESTSNEPFDIVIYDIAGKAMETIKGKNVNEDIIIGDKLSSGMYFIDVKQGNVSQKARVVKMK